MLFVDIGNSNIAWKINNTYHTTAIENFDAQLIPPHTIAIISCVANQNLIKNFNNSQVIQAKPYKNLQFNYKLEQLGIDRYLAIIAGFNLYKNNDLMIIDSGTFTTIDYIKNDCHIGGGITPGIEKLINIHKFSGSDSQENWHFGVKNMFINYVLTQIDNFINTGNKILITGGGQKTIKAALKIKYQQHYDDRILYHQNLVLTGLEIIHKTHLN